mmetsp:Transcript_11383/g.20588  ORF Transcript_11383/g.20588 Transcript_11383/m.20588 type:complete len:234 (+) Transcript_11383:550-1251(+)
MAVALEACWAAAFVECGGGVREPIPGKLLVMGNGVHAGAVRLPVHLATPALVVARKARVGQVGLAVVVARLVVAGASLAGAIWPKVLGAEVPAFIHIEAQRLAILLSPHPALSTIAFVRIEGIDTLGLSFVGAFNEPVAGTFRGAHTAVLALIGRHVGSVAHVWFVVFGEGGAKATQHFVPLERATVLPTVDAHRRKDGHLAHIVIANLRILLCLQQRVFHILVRVANALAQA